MMDAEKALKELSVIHGWYTYDVRATDENVTLEIDSFSTIHEVTFQNVDDFYSHINAMLPWPVV
jgi:hypothetical protein